MTATALKLEPGVDGGGRASPSGRAAGPADLSPASGSSQSSIPDAVCRGNVTNLGAYFFEGRRVHEACKRQPAFRVFVNPPKPGNDGTVLLCKHCNNFDYIGFRREPFDPLQSHGAGSAGL